MKRNLKWMITGAGVICILFFAINISLTIKEFLRQEPKGDHISISIVESSFVEEESGSQQETSEWTKWADTEESTQWEESIPQETVPEQLEESQEESENKNIDENRRRIVSSWRYKIPLPPPVEEEEVLPQESKPPVAYIVSDLHYMSSATTDYGEAFDEMVKRSDGKVAAYLPQLLDALIEEVSQAKPDVLILTGDNVMDGEKVSHQELAEKLSVLLEQGIQVLTIPGNHDINNPWARVYFGEEEEKTENISPEEYEEIYGNLGWNQAINRDSASFSYIYPLGTATWLMLLDTAWYIPENLVGGAVREETLKWMEENLKVAKRHGIQVIVLGHHNLLQESRMYNTMCVMENSNEVTWLLEKYEVPLYISGHLHLQRIKRHQKEPGDENYGIYEIVSDAFSIPPCQYGILAWQEDYSVDYSTHQVDVSGWAEKNGITDENLLNFSEYQTEYVKQLVENQIKQEMFQIPQDQIDAMARFYADVYADYCAGLEIDMKEAQQTQAYSCWERYFSGSKRAEELRSMMKDSFQDNNLFILQE